MGLLGIFLGLALLLGMSFRGWSVLLLAPAAALIGAAFSGEPLLAHLTQTFMEGAARFMAQFFPIFLLGAVFGKLMEDSGSVSAIADFMTRKLGAERAILADVDVFAFVYPFWFNAPPAILMGYVDRVFGMDFGFRQGPAGNEPRLAGRSLISFSFSGAPDQWVRDTGALAALEAVFENHICNVCGLRLADHLHIGGIVPDLRKDAFEDILSAIRDTAIRNFGAQAPQLAE